MTAYKIVAIALAAGAVFDVLVLVVLLHWHGVVAEDQRDEDARLSVRERDITLAEEAYTFQLTRANRYQRQLLEETASKDRRRRPRLELVDSSWPAVSYTDGDYAPPRAGITVRDISFHPTEDTAS